ncbi:hypothetical protein ANO11243_019970 [Dothideomycetidae sp. 11243]|nr:hypothetical protein ANO11243_019970 [fungal sp. No.11243]
MAARITPAAEVTPHLPQEGSEHISEKPNGEQPSVKAQTTKPKRPPRRNFGKIHSKPLPYEIFPLPAFVPHNPLSIIRILGALLGELFSRSSSEPNEKYVGLFSFETRSVHVTDPKHIRVLWEMGFFGKGSLSRSEPTWLDRERARRKAAAGGTSEEATNKRRQDRRQFKLERARLEREMIEEQLRKEGKLLEVRPETEQKDQMNGPATLEAVTQSSPTKQPLVSLDGGQTDIPSTNAPEITTQTEDIDDLEEDAPLVDQEHLQLSLQEAFFLSYGLGVLDIHITPRDQEVVAKTSAPLKQSILGSKEMLSLFATHSAFPTLAMHELRPDNPFLLSYITYHHYRSLGWVVRPGTKFAADWMLYNRGPVFSHAEFTVTIVPEYPDGWHGQWGNGPSSRVRQKEWWEMHCTNRIQSQVQKTLVLCYVEVPLQVDLASGDIGQVLKSYKVRDFVVRRWLANRSRD